MAINKIAGETLESNLIRSTDLSFNDTLLHLDVTNGRIGVGTASPGNFELDVVGNINIADTGQGLDLRTCPSKLLIGEWWIVNIRRHIYSEGRR